DQDADADDFGAGDAHIESYWVSPWLRGGNVVGRKRWKRPEFVIDTNVTRSLLVEIFKDYDYAAVARTFNLVTQADGTYLVWDVGNWGEDLWGTEDSDRDGIVRGTSLGNARAIALRVRGPSTNHSWRLNAISLKYIPKPLRS